MLRECTSKTNEIEIHAHCFFNEVTVNNQGIYTTLPKRPALTTATIIFTQSTFGKVNQVIVEFFSAVIFKNVFIY